MLQHIWKIVCCKIIQQVYHKFLDNYVLFSYSVKKLKIYL